MKILISGGSGYIGLHASKALLDIGLKFISVDNFANSSIHSIQALRSLQDIDFKFIEGDLSDHTLLDSLFSEHKITGVVHFAGYKAVGESVESPLKYYQNNLGSTLSLLEVMKRHGVFNLVFSSSATVYGDSDVLPIPETAKRSATNPYGRTKLFIEHMLEDLANSDPRWKIANLRYFNPVGAHESGMIGEDPNGIPNNLMPFISQVAVGKLDKLKVFGGDYDTPDGTGVRDYIHVMDLAEGHLAALNFLSNLDKGGFFPINLGTGKGISVLQMIEAFSKASGTDIPYEIVDRRLGDVASCYADVRLAKELLGWEARRSLEDMCRDTWRWQSRNPNGYRDRDI